MMKVSDIFSTNDIDATEFSENAYKDLLLPIDSRQEINRIELEGILRATSWLDKTRKKDFLSVEFIKEVHFRMFEGIWTWAGKIRKTETNIGVVPYYITSELIYLFENVKYWLENETYTLFEIGVKLHHRLVCIHPFKNGNGRLARIFTDFFMKKHKQKPFKWGEGDLIGASEIRKIYIKALKDADLGNFCTLENFLKN